jgi:response regulator RpfG family c-di-GMP phosphodiesterase
MSKSGDIVIVEDDIDDRIFLQNVFDKLNIENEIIWFDNTDDTLNFLSKTTRSIFLIFSDINLPGKNGLELKRTIDTTPKLRKKSIPFVFYSTAAHQRDINEAYTEMTVQGFFKKGLDTSETENIIKTIFDYWTLCKHPNTQQ